MDIKEILKKIAEGKPLTDEEKAFAAKYDPEKDESRIPKSRLDQELAKFKAEKERADKLDEQLKTLNAKVEELESKGMSEVEKTKTASEKELKQLRTQVETLTKERDEAKTNFERSERTAKISALAAKHSFSNPDYLDYLAKSKEIDLNDEGAAAGFMKDLGKSNPELFKSTAKPGGGTNPSAKVDSGAKTRLDELMKKPNLSSREAGEVIELSEQIKKADGGDGKTAKQGE